MKKNILVFPAGSEVGLEINRALTDIRDINVIGATSVDDHSLFAFSKVRRLPFFTDSNFLTELNKLIANEGIDFIYPAHDDLVELLPYLEETGQLENGVKVISSHAETTKIARSKRLTYKALSDVIETPEVYDDLSDIPDFPVFAKPDVGQGSKGVFVIKDTNDLRKVSSGHIVCEYLPGPEYTIDCFTDRNGNLLFSGGRIRARISNGISVSSKEFNDSAIHEIAKRINKKLKLRGAWFFQLKKRDNGDLVLLEIACRVSGGMGFYRAKGVNLPLLSIYDHDKKIERLDIFQNKIDIIRDSALNPRYKVDFFFEHVYVDFDDNLIFDDKTNYKLLGLLYKYKNENKKIYLITRHRQTYNKSPKDTLAEHKIAESLFEEIIEIDGNDKKSDFIYENNSIFIDDSTKERNDVHINRQIPTFTCNQAFELFF